MARLESKDTAFSLESLFAEDEVLQEVDPNWEESELLEQEGVFPFSKVLEKLEMDKKRLREFAKTQSARGVDVYSQYGLKKMNGGQWRIRMKTFRDKLDELRERFSTRKQPGPIKKLPKAVSREAFFKLRGYFKLKDVMTQGYLPYDFREVLFILNRDNLPQEVSGCWKGAREWYVDLVPFILFLYARYQNLPLEEVRARFADQFRT